MPTLKHGYWNIRGLAAPSRMMAAYAGVEMEDVQYDIVVKPEGGFDGSAWFAKDKPALAEKNPMVNLPYVHDTENDLVVTQSTAVYLYLGRKFNLCGSTPVELARAEMALAQSLDLRDALIKVVYPFTGTTAETYPKVLEDHLTKVVPGHYTKFEGFIGDLPFIAGESVTLGDFHLWEMLDQHELMAKSGGHASPLAAYPKLSAFYARFRELPQLKAYFDGADYKLPVNNKMSFFIK